MRRHTTFFVLIAIVLSPINLSAAEPETVAVIGTGDMGNSLGPKLAGIGYRVIYGSRDPSRDYVKKLVARTGHDATATTHRWRQHRLRVSSCWRWGGRRWNR